MTMRMVWYGMVWVCRWRWCACSTKSANCWWNTCDSIVTRYPQFITFDWNLIKSQVVARTPKPARYVSGGDCRTGDNRHACDGERSVFNYWSFEWPWNADHWNEIRPLETGRGMDLRRARFIRMFMANHFEREMGGSDHVTKLLLRLRSSTAIYLNLRITMPRSKWPKRGKLHFYLDPRV